jgi:GNAT superfamily N-acetyltransferase
MGAGRKATIELAAAADAAAIADLYLAARADALPWLRRVHSDAATRDWIVHDRLARGENWIARVGEEILGFMALDREDLDQLYLKPGHYRRGIGSQLMAKAKERSPRRLHLFCFQRNLRARAFYESHGFVIADLNDGSRNVEGEPDILYVWQASA